MTNDKPWFARMLSSTNEGYAFFPASALCLPDTLNPHTQASFWLQLQIFHMPHPLDVSVHCPWNHGLFFKKINR